MSDTTILEEWQPWYKSLVLRIAQKERDYAIELAGDVYKNHQVRFDKAVNQINNAGRLKIVEIIKILTKLKKGL